MVDLPWIWLNQVHGSEVVAVRGGGDVTSLSGAAADALVTAEPDVALAIQTADCMPVVMYSPEGVFGVAHAGWRGLRAGVLEATAHLMRSMGASQISCESGPCIGPECYEFGGVELDELAAVFGSDVIATTAMGTRGLDLHRMLDVIADRIGADVVARHGSCTACAAGSFFSHRARLEHARMATVAWRPSVAHPREIDG